MAVAAVLLSLVPTSPWAGGWAPHHRWQSLETPHFVITYHEGEAPLATELAFVAEEVHAILVPELGWAPRGRTHVVLVDATDDANGYAQTIPFNTITLYAIPPRVDTTLDNHENWLFSLFVHEYAHVLQIDLAGGLPLALRQVFGRMIMPGSVLPAWLTEGYATWVETRFTAGGRGRSTFADGLFRLAALQGAVPRVDQAEGRGHAFPGGSVRYLYGGRFHLFVEAEKGREAWARFHQRHGRMIVPFVLPAKAAFDESLRSLWRRFREDLARRAVEEQERVARAGGSSHHVLPTRRGSSTSPRYSPDGSSVLYQHGSPYEGSSLRRFDLRRREDAVVVPGRAQGARFEPRRGRLWASRTAYSNRWESFDDLYRIQIEPDGQRARVPRGKGEGRATGGEDGLERPAPSLDVASDADRAAPSAVGLPPMGEPAGPGAANPRRTRAAAWVRASRGLRLFDPAPHPMEDWAVAVQGGPGHHDLVRIDPVPVEKEARKPQRSSVRTLLDGPDGSTFSGPVFSPDGRRIAVSVHKPGGFRDIHVIDTEGRVLRVLGWDRSLDADPAWSPDGRWLLFASDRSGTWEIYACAWEDGHWRRLTRTLGGARHPDVRPDGQFFAFQVLDVDGWRIGEQVFDPARAPIVTLDPRALPSPDWGPSAQAAAPLSRTEGVPGPPVPAGDGPLPALARARARGAWDHRPEPGAGQTQVPPPPMFRPYLGFRTLFPPRYVLPTGAITDRGVLGGLATGGWDVLRQFGWSASIHVRSDTAFIGGGAAIEIAPLGPALQASWSTTSLDWGRLWLRSSGPAGRIAQNFAGSFRSEDRYHERRDRLLVGLQVPWRRHDFSARYKLELRGPIRALPVSVDPALLPARGSFSGLVLGWRWGELTRHPASISSEDGRSIALSADIESSALGAFRLEPDGARSPLHRAVIGAELRGYLPLPWPGSHVLAARFVAGLTLGTKVPQRTFRLGGSFGDSPYLSLPDRFYALRGYPTASLRGDHAWLATVEYRLPLLRIGRGPWTLPLWLRSLALSIWGEAGAAVDDADFVGLSVPMGLQRFALATRPAAGAELVGDAVALWGTPLVGRLGWGYGFGDGALQGGGFYAQVGSSF